MGAQGQAQGGESGLGSGLGSGWSDLARRSTLVEHISAEDDAVQSAVDLFRKVDAVACLLGVRLGLGPGLGFRQWFRLQLRLRLRLRLRL